MSRAGDKLGARKSTEDKKKRDRASSPDVTSHKKLKMLGTLQKVPKSTKSPLDHVKSWLVNASEKELDTLTNFLLSRKGKVSSARTKYTEKNEVSVPGGEVPTSVGGRDKRRNPRTTPADTSQVRARIT